MTIKRDGAPGVCAQCGGGAPLCHACLARLVQMHRDWAIALGRQWGLNTPRASPAPSWDCADDRERALRLVSRVRLVDERARESLARICLDASGERVRLRAESQRKRRPYKAPSAPPVAPPEGVWLVSLQGQPYTGAQTIGAVGFEVHRRMRFGAWAVLVAADGAPLKVPIDATREAFEHAVGASGTYRLIPVDESGARVGVAPSVVLIS